MGVRLKAALQGGRITRSTRNIHRGGHLIVMMGSSLSLYRVPVWVAQPERLQRDITSAQGAQQYRTAPLARNSSAVHPVFDHGHRVKDSHRRR